MNHVDTQLAETSPTVESTSMAEEAASPWWRDAVVYQVYIRSFADADGDGVGDIAGIRSRLPYLHELGIDALWITPWYLSPQADGGYDVTDYRQIDPLFGTLADAEALIREAHGYGIRIIPDIVPKHTSIEHEWFQAAVAAGPGSPERELFGFRPGRGENGELPEQLDLRIRWTRLDPRHRAGRHAGRVVRPHPRPLPA